MATYKHLRSSTANKRPTTSITDGQLAINTNTASPGLFFKDSAGTGIVKVGPVHVGTTAPNATPAAGGSSGNYLGEQWLDTSVSPAQMKVWNGSAWVGIVADELPVSKLQDGDARQLLQTDAAGTGVEWTSNVDVPGTLDVTGATTLDSTLTVPLGSAGAPTITFTGDTNTGIYSPGADQVAVATNGTGRVFVDASGNVGIGATPNSYAGYSTLTINNTTGSELDFEVNGTLTSDIYTDSAAAYWTTRTAVPIVLRTNSTERLRITSAGNVGIGVTGPGSKLEVGGEAAPRIGINATGTGTTGLLFQGAGTTYGSIIENISSGELAIKSGASGQNSYFITFGTNDGTERARIDSSGRLLVGTSTAPSSGSYNQFGKLIVQGNTFNASSNSVLSLNRGEGAASITSGEELGVVVFGDSAGNEFGSIQCVADAAAGSGDYPGRLAFFTTADGAGSPTERMRITSDAYVRLAAGTGGIQFNGDTAAANALDDYEEGTWTPVDGSGAGLTFTSVQGRYTKVGNQVTCWGTVTYPTTANGNVAKISGLPFTTNINDSVRAGGFIAITGNPNNYQLFLENNATAMPILSSTAAGTTNADNSTYGYYFIVNYFV